MASQARTGGSISGRGPEAVQQQDLCTVGESGNGGGPLPARPVAAGRVSTRKATTERPGLSAALDYLRPGDALVVWKLDRLGRSVKDVLTIGDDLHERYIGVWILTGKLAVSYSPTGEGKFFFTMMAAFAELERDIIHKRTMAGLAAARAQRRRGGRPTVMDDDKLAAARARCARGESPAKIAKALGGSAAGGGESAEFSARIWECRTPELPMQPLECVERQLDIRIE